MDRSPRIQWTDIFAGAFIYLGFLLFLVALHLLAIGTEGNTQDVLNTVFIVFVTLYSGAFIFGIAGVVIHILKVLTWQINTPAWKKERMKKDGY